MLNILHVVGARPNFMKVAPVLAALDSRLMCSQRLVHTGQHYDANMSDVFFSAARSAAARCEPRGRVGVACGANGSDYDPL